MRPVSLYGMCKGGQLCKARGPQRSADKSKQDDSHQCCAVQAICGYSALLRPGSIGKAPQAYRHHRPVWPMAPHSTCPESDHSCRKSPDGIVMLGASLPVHTQKAPVLPVARDSIVPVLYNSVELMNLAEQLILHSKYQHHQGSDVVCGVLDSQQRLSGTGVSSSACMSVRQSHVVSLWGQKASCTRQGPGQKASGPCNGQGGRARLLLVIAGQHSRKYQKPCW